MESLIQEVKKHTALYDHRDDNFHDKQHKSNIWAQIANSLNYSSCRQAEKEWEQLVQKFRDTIEKQISVDMEENQPGERKWNYSQHMEFLLPFLVKKVESDGSNTKSSALNTNPKDQSANNAIEDQFPKDPNVCDDGITKIKEEKVVTENIKEEIDIDEDELKSAISDHMQTEVKIEETELAISDVMVPTTEDELKSFVKCENNEIDMMASNTYNDESSFDEEDHFDEALETEDEDSETENEQKPDSLYHFLMSMYSTTKRMPEVLQTRIQNKISEALAETDAIMQESGITENFE